MTSPISTGQLRDYFMTAEDAREFGIVDEVITKREPIDEKLRRLAPVS